MPPEGNHDNHGNHDHGDPMQDPASDKPIAKSVFVGRSDSFSLEEALRSAVSAARPVSASADTAVPFVLQRIFGQYGGATGERCLCAEIRVDEEVSHDIPGGLSRSQPAQSLSVVAPAIEKIELGVLASRPPQFVLRGLRQMPTPGWTFHIDSVTSEPASGRIVVQLTDVPPDGVVSALGPTPIALQLGSLRAGSYVVEIHSRRSPNERHQLLQAVVVEAT
jgi:hypothetical protein